ncbi:MAG: tripartite tricarboxylate transporter substrate binding protein [Bulleidia sp.]|nr:tripartite tricarboxylate transporter substrate binding protein [Bulleidia sp.]
MKFEKGLKFALSAVMALTLAGCGSSTAASEAAPVAEESQAAAADNTATEGNTVDWPNNTITLYCGYSAGGGSDVISRIMAEALTKELGQTVIVEDVTGSGGWVLWQQMITATEPDGYTFFLINTPNYPLGKYDTANPRQYGIDDVDLLCNWVSDYNTIAIRKDDDRFNDWDSFLAYWKENPLISSASAVGVMSDDATLIDRLQNEFGTKTDMVQSKGASDNITMLLSGTTDFAVCNASEMANGHLSGEYKVIAIAAPERDKNLPDVPTIKELTGIEMVGDSCRGFALPKGVDPAIREKLMTALKTCINSDEVQKKMADIYTPVNYVEGDDYYNLMVDRIEQGLTAYGRESEMTEKKR